VRLSASYDAHRLDRTPLGFWLVGSGMTELMALTGVDPTSELRFALPSQELEGVCIFHGTAWL
jgi:hypothetical protein